MVHWALRATELPRSALAFGILIENQYDKLEGIVSEISAAAFFKTRRRYAGSPEHPPQGASADAKAFGGFRLVHVLLRENCRDDLPDDLVQRTVQVKSGRSGGEQLMTLLRQNLFRRAGGNVGHLGGDHETAHHSDELVDVPLPGKLLEQQHGFGREPHDLGAKPGVQRVDVKPYQGGNVAAVPS